MHTFFLIAAGIGGTLVLLQFLAGAFGIGGDHAGGDGHELGHDADTDHDHGDNWFLGLLTFRAVCAAVAFFGLGGLVGSYYGLTNLQQLGCAFGAGFLALYLVATLMKALYKLRADGTVRIEHAVGKTGTVYLRVPANKAGAGKVTLALQGRTVEVEAFTAGDELPTGSPIRVVGAVGANAVEVAHIHAPTEA